MLDKHGLEREGKRKGGREKGVKMDGWIVVIGVEGWADMNVWMKGRKLARKRGREGRIYTE